MRKLIIFDLDQVLIKHNNNLIVDRMSFAVNKVFKLNTKIGEFPTGGMTDTSIMLELARRAGIDRKTAARRMDALYKAEIDYVRKHIKDSDIALYPGALQLLKRLKKDGHIICVATGNLKPIASMKLDKLGVKSYFRFGGFGTSLKRADLIRDAIKQARRKYGKISKKNIFYFGDSLLDVKGGKAAGVNMIAVATGTYSAKALAKEKPDYVLNDLKDTRKVMSIINS